MGEAPLYPVSDYLLTIRYTIINRSHSQEGEVWARQHPTELRAAVLEQRARLATLCRAEPPVQPRTPKPRDPEIGASNQNWARI